MDISVIGEHHIFNGEIIFINTGHDRIFVKHAVFLSIAEQPHYQLFPKEIAQAITKTIKK